MGSGKLASWRGHDNLESPTEDNIKTNMTTAASIIVAAFPRHS
jgi:hypothetical protein